MDGIYIFKEYRSNCRRDGLYGILRSQDSGSSKKYLSVGSDALYVAGGFSIIVNPKAEEG